MSQDLHRRKSKKTNEPQGISSKGDEKKGEDEIGTLDKYLPKSLADFIYVKLWEPHPASSLASVRICWGLIMCWEMLTWMMNGFSKVNYILSLRTSFKYYGFEWVTPWPGYGLHAHIVINTILSLCVAFGFKYKIASFLYFLGFSYLFLLEMTLYLNHFYLVAIMCLMFVFLPADCYWSVDAALDEKKKSKTVPFWTIWLLRTFIGLVYVYAGIAKINEDWFRGEPLLHWLPRRRDTPILGYFFVQPWLAYLFSLGGLVLDLFLPFALWIPTIRPLAFLSCVFFHVMNKIIFNIGIFPWVMLASTSIHFETDWLIWIGQVWQGRRKVYEKPKFPYQPRRKLNFNQKVIVICIILFFTQQILTPLRHWTYPGNVNWTEEGHRWSWRMKLRDKDASAKFFARDPVTKNNHEVDLNYWLGYKQYRKMSCRPELIHLFAHRVAQAWNESTGNWPKVTAEVICSLNYRPYQHMVKPDYDLAAIPPWTWPQEWVYPLVPLGDVDNPLIVKNFTTETRKFANQYFYDHLGD